MNSSPEENLFSNENLAGDLGELFRRVSQSREIAASDRDILRAALFNPMTPPADLRAIDRLHWAARRGRLRMVE